MESKDIIKALKCCLNGKVKCKSCLYDKVSQDTRICTTKLCEDTLDLIKNQQAEIEKLQTNYNSLKDQEEKAHQYCKSVCEPKYKAEIERLKQNQKIHIHIDEQFKKECEYEIQTARNEAYKEIFNKLRKGLKWLPLTVMNERFITEGQINDLEKRLTKDKMKDIERFFMSSWGKFLCEGNEDRIIKYCRYNEVG